VASQKFNEYSGYVKVLHESISTYISKMFSSGNLTELQSEQTAGLLCVSNNIERIAERCDEIDKSYGKINRQCSKSHFGRVKNKKCSKAMSGDYTEILQNIGRITDNCVGIAEEAMDNVKFMTLDAEEMEQYGQIIDFAKSEQMQGGEA